MQAENGRKSLIFNVRKHFHVIIQPGIQDKKELPAVFHEANGLLLYFGLLLLSLVSRIFLLFQYSSSFVDDDQALMWNGAAALAHFTLAEPCFWGQAYGSMFESLVAVPLYWLHIPLNYAMPLAASAVGTLPFIYVAENLRRKGKLHAACLVMLIFFSMGWKWDILTSIPRSLISGVPFAVCGSLLMNERNNSQMKLFIGTFLSIYGILMTSTVAAIAALGFFVFFIYHKHRRSSYYWVFAGCLVGGILFLLRKNFYAVNRDFSLHPSPAFTLSLKTFLSNVKRLPVLLADFTFTENGYFVLAGIGIALGILAAKRHWKTMVLLLLNVLLFAGLMSIEKTAWDYGENSVLYSQSRMFLYWPYSILPVVFFDVEEYESSIVQFRVTKKMSLIIFIPVLIVFSFKTWTIQSQIDNPNSELNNPYMCRLYKTEDLIKSAETINAYAMEANADVIVTVDDNRALSYLFDAVNYGKYTVYNITYDRRTWNYHYLKEPRAHRCLFVTSSTGEIKTQIKDLSDVSVVDYIFQEYGEKRNPY